MDRFIWLFSGKNLREFAETGSGIGGQSANGVQMDFGGALSFYVFRLRERGLGSCRLGDTDWGNRTAIRLEGG